MRTIRKMKWKSKARHMWSMCGHRWRTCGCVCMHAHSCRPTYWHTVTQKVVPMFFTFCFMVTQNHNKAKQSQYVGVCKRGLVKGYVWNQELCNLMMFPWRYSQFILGTHWDIYLYGHQKYNNMV